MPKRFIGTFIVSILAGISTALIVELYLRPRLANIKESVDALVSPQ